MSSVLLVVEHRNGKTKTATLNALTFAQQAAEKLKAKLCLLVIGKMCRISQRHCDRLGWI